jgi:hypothetical protein
MSQLAWREEKVNVYGGVGAANAVRVVVEAANATGAIANGGRASLWLTFGSLGRMQETQNREGKGKLDHDPIEKAATKRKRNKASMFIYSLWCSRSQVHIRTWQRCQAPIVA